MIGDIMLKLFERAILKNILRKFLEIDPLSEESSEILVSNIDSKTMAKFIKRTIMSFKNVSSHPIQIETLKTHQLKILIISFFQNSKIVEMNH